jgi:chemotaxis protein methyltransferase CheR
MERQPEFAFTDQDFDRIRGIVSANCGIALADHKRQLVYGRLTRRLRQLRLRSFAEYCELLRDGGTDEVVHLVNAITTNVTGFFREAHHFEFLGRTVVPERLAEGATRLRFWSAGCSTGEEPYSIAITLAEALADTRGIDARILATDVDANVVATANAGIYALEKLASVDSTRRARWFERGGGRAAGKARVKADLKNRMVNFARLNLMQPWPMHGPFDAIFCRNVVIYFDRPTRKRLAARFAELLRPGGYLFLGHSESLHGLSNCFSLIGRTIYRKDG